MSAHIGMSQSRFTIGRMLRISGRCDHQAVARRLVLPMLGVGAFGLALAALQILLPFPWPRALKAILDGVGTLALTLCALVIAWCFRHFGNRHLLEPLGAVEPEIVLSSEQPQEVAQSDLTGLAIANHTLQLEIEARVRSEEKYRRLFENAAEGIYQTTPEGAFIAANPALARILGYDSPDELIEAVENVAAQVYVDPARREKFSREMTEKSSVTAFESQVRRRDGTMIWVMENAHVVRDEHGEIFCFEGSVQDISLRKAIETERERLLADALERADR